MTWSDLANHGLSLICLGLIGWGLAWLCGQLVRRDDGDLE